MHRLDIALLLAWIIVLVPLASAQALQTENWATETIRASPSRVILGNLPYGVTDNSARSVSLTITGFSSGVTLTVIDLSRAEGIHIASRQDSHDEIVLTLGIDLKKFSANQPYGALVKKIIRIETSSPDEPQLIIPVVGWLGTNETSRDFSRFIFNGCERWEGWWSTPNIAGSVLAPMILLLLGSSAWLWTNRKRGTHWLNISLLVLLLLECGALLILLSFTYSRGAWFAFAVGGAVMLVCSGTLRATVSFALLFFCLSLFLLPAGLQRIESYSHVEQDLSVANRLKLWTGALQMMAEHPVAGIGADRFGDVFERDYQRFDHKAKNSTAVSDYFTFGAEHGVLLLATGLVLILIVVRESVREALKDKNLPRMTLSAMLVAILVASAFSTLWFVREYQWIFAGTLLGLLTFLATQLYRTRSNKAEIRSLLVRSGQVAAGTCIVLGVLLSVGLGALPTKSRELKVELPDYSYISCQLVEPRWKQSKGLVVYFPNSMEGDSLLCHATLRPLAALGWKVISPKNLSDQVEAGQFLETLSRTFPGQRLFVAGDHAGGRMAWLTALEKQTPRPMAGAGFGFLSSELISTYNQSSSPPAFLVGQNLYDDHVSANATIRLQRQAELKPSGLTLQLTEGDSSHFSQDWMKWLRRVDAYFSTR